LKRVVYSIVRISSYISLGSLFVLTFLVTSDVIGRYIFMRPIKGTEDISEIIMVLTVFLSLGLTQYVKGHVSIDIITSRLQERYKVILNCFTSFIAFLFFLLVAWQLSNRALILLFTPARGETATLGIPHAPFMLIAAVGCVLLSLVLLIDFYDSLNKKTKPETINERSE